MPTYRARRVVDSPLDPFRAAACHAIPGRPLRPTDISSTNGSLSDGCNERHSLSPSRERGEGRQAIERAERASEVTNVRGETDGRNDFQACWPCGSLAVVRTVLMTSERKGRTKRGVVGPTDSIGGKRVVRIGGRRGSEASGAAETKRLIAAISVALCCHFHCRLH